MEGGLLRRVGILDDGETLDEAPLQQSKPVRFRVLLVAHSPYFDHIHYLRYHLQDVFAR